MKFLRLWSGVWNKDLGTKDMSVRKQRTQIQKLEKILDIQSRIAQIKKAKISSEGQK